MTENLLEKIQADFKSAFEKDSNARNSFKKIMLKKASFTDADTVTKSAGKALRGAFEKYASDLSDVDTLREILTKTLGKNYDLINKICADVQAIADEKIGINLKPQRADFPARRVDNLAKYTAGRDLEQPSAVRDFGAAVENINNAIYTDYIRTNAKFRESAGLKVLVSRDEGAGCCSWCSKLTGAFELDKAPKNFWQRHKNCTCVIDYINEKTGTADRITFVDLVDRDNRDRLKKIETKKRVRRLTPEQARKLQDRVLTGGGNGGIIGAGGLGAHRGGGLVSEHKPPLLVKVIDPTDEEAIRKELMDFEKSVVGEPIEHACVITKSGKVYHCYGDKDHVYIDADLGDEINGAYVTHNHLIEETEFSFSNDDFSMFETRNMEILRGCDEKYVYELNRNADDIDEEVINWQNEENVKHSAIRDLAYERGYGYRRKPI